MTEETDAITLEREACAAFVEYLQEGIAELISPRELADAIRKRDCFVPPSVAELERARSKITVPFHFTGTIRFPDGRMQHWERGVLKSADLTPTQKVMAAVNQLIAVGVPMNHKQEVKRNLVRDKEIYVRHTITLEVPLDPDDPAQVVGKPSTCPECGCLYGARHDPSCKTIDALCQDDLPQPEYVEVPQ